MYLRIQSKEKVPPNYRTKDQAKLGATQDIPPKPQAKKNTSKTKKDTGKWFKFHKSHTHNTSEYQAKHSLVAELKASESDPGFDSESQPDKGTNKWNQIIDV